MRSEYGEISVLSEPKSSERGAAPLASARRSKIYQGEVYHGRPGTRGHKFRYPVYFLRLDLDELEELSESTPLFSYNGRNVSSLWDEDFLPHRTGPIREKIRDVLRATDPTLIPARIELITQARVFGYAFNPVSFYLVFDQSDRLRALVAEVNNTFGETHLYVLPGSDVSGDVSDEHSGERTLHPAEAEAGDRRYASKQRFRCCKDFHVSPFFDRKGDYQFRVALAEDRFAIDVDLEKEGRIVLRTRLSGKGEEFTTAELRRTLLRFPFATFLTIPRITYQAAQLYFRHKLPVFKKPIAHSSDTVRVAGPTLVQRIAMRIVFKVLRRMSVGSLKLQLPRGAEFTFGVKEEGVESARIAIHDYAFFTRLVTSGEIGFGESYIAGEWDSSDVVGLMRLLTKNAEIYRDRTISFNRFTFPVYHLMHWLRRNSLVGSKRNIVAHYDLGNDFYESFLDESMQYSSAVFQSEGQSLELAQRSKLGLLFDRLEMRTGERVLEIGTGWGALALEGAHRGADMTTTTISDAQYDYAAKRFAAAGMSDRIQLFKKDYRELSGQFDRIVSVEMLEAVGEEFLPTFFQKCQSLLRPGGTMVLQFITIDDRYYDDYRKGSDFIRQHVFPGGHLLSVSHVRSVVMQHTDLQIDSVEEIGPHYATTLREWRSRFERSTFADNSEFARKWQFYLAYCEAGFDAGVIGNVHVTLRRP